jgi:stage II sporulation protein D
VSALSRWGRAAFALGAVCAGVALSVVPMAGSTASASASAVEVYPVPPGGQFTLHGRGYGHGHGMSQWGAYGAAAVKHLTAAQIVAFYYPHTSLARRMGVGKIRVDLSAAESFDTGYLTVAPATGLAVTYGAKTLTLPTKRSGHLVTAWRLDAVSGTVLRLQARAHGIWSTLHRVGAAATFRDPARQIPVVVPGGVTRTYRGTIGAVLESGYVETVNTLGLGSYLRSVVPMEMSASWSAAALQAQAIAARSYAEYAMAHPHGSWFDIYGDTRDQAYGGVGAEYAASTSAVTATAHEVLETSGGSPIFAQFGAADGGWTAAGGAPYLPAEKDPYDGLVSNTAHAWTTIVSEAAVESLAPSIGTLKDLEVTGRDGQGIWGGGVTTVRLVGSAGSATISGTTFQADLGLRSTWWRPTPTPGAPLTVTATASGTSVTVAWQAPAAVSGSAAVTGYRVSLSPSGTHKSVGASTHTVTFTGLTKGTTYTVTVVAKSSAGKGPGTTATVTP